MEKEPPRFSIRAVEAKLRKEDPPTYWLTRVSLAVSTISLGVAIVTLLVAQ